MKNNFFLSIFTLVFVAVMAQGCANKLPYSNVNVSFNVAGSGKLAVATQDLRPYILNANKTPDFVGLVRGGYGNPFDVTTESGKPLAEEITRALSTSFQKSGFTTTPIIVSPSENDRATKDKFLAAQTNQSVLLLLKEWKSDSFHSTSLLYDVTLQVLDGSAKVVAEKQINGNGSVGGSMKTIPQAFIAKLEELINSPEIQRALTNKNTFAVDTRPAEQPVVQEIQIPRYSPTDDTARPVYGNAAVRDTQNVGKVDAGDIESRLEKLKNLFDKELISEDEYYRERTRVLGSM